MTEQALPRIAWTPREVAAMAGVHYETVLDEIRLGKIPATKFGTAYRIPDYYVQNFADPTGQREPITAPPPRRTTKRVSSSKK